MGENNFRRKIVFLVRKRKYSAERSALVNLDKKRV